MLKEIRIKESDNLLFVSGLGPNDSYAGKNIVDNLRIIGCRDCGRFAPKNATLESPNSCQGAMLINMEEGGRLDQDAGTPVLTGGVPCPLTQLTLTVLENMLK